MYVLKGLVNSPNIGVPPARLGLKTGEEPYMEFLWNRKYSLLCLDTIATLDPFTVVIHNAGNNCYYYGEYMDYDQAIQKALEDNPEIETEIIDDKLIFSFRGIPFAEQSRYSQIYDLDAFNIKGMSEALDIPALMYSIKNISRRTKRPVHYS
jgi:hypothetical protein